MTQSKFEQYGGFAVVSRIVLDFYNRLLDDDLLGPFFEDVDLPRIVDHQTKFLAMLLGGPAHYTDEQISRLHRHLDIRGEHYDRMTALLAETLRDHNFAEPDLNEVIAQFEARRGLMVGMAP
ncbi:group I truncated hemoglobin [Chelativorans intermedius]|uniref:Group 1 truncated hemoglobin n=1 Tax=Chelativorans intermedius TaxID=515947 RepID=A0ABV6D2M4_9HYPH|nr:group 1 truncated hemoglobin [Chelativorans intermedius]MCT8997296.1 group 1 truncated hemoglobin [Chelativorans intermedius]